MKFTLTILPLINIDEQFSHIFISLMFSFLFFFAPPFVRNSVNGVKITTRVVSLVLFVCCRLIFFNSFPFALLVYYYGVNLNQLSCVVNTQNESQCRNISYWWWEKINNRQSIGLQNSHTPFLFDCYLHRSILFLLIARKTTHSGKKKILRENVFVVCSKFFRSLKREKAKYSVLWLTCRNFSFLNTQICNQSIHLI